MKNSFSRFWIQVNRDKWLILLCIGLAFFAWQGIRKTIGLELPVSNITVDVAVPEGWAVWEKSVHRVNIEFRGSREDFRYMNNEQLKVVVPVANPEHGKEMTIKLSEKFLKNPTGAKVVSFSPSEIVVRLDQESERSLPVKAAIEGSLPAGLEIERIVCTPASVSVAGARQVLDEMENIHTEPVDLKDRKGSFKESVPIALPQAGRMRVAPDWVSVEFFIEAHSSTETFEKIPVRTMCAPGEKRQISVQPLTVEIIVQGQQQKIEKLRASDIFAYVACHDLTESAGYDLPVEVDLPTGLQLVKTEPAVVHIEIGTTH
ncbi:CdaA regulatory protein CdaR [Pontiella desulfatans]|uniref:CdaA regulatory protein CdaR n=1 Tax=Pontiella desulfatans TaxID=2750659 RepID=A0A6C2UB55_PONDE|nr:CdaR family protein [Pontiella desulfatans]VGO17378.1 CdaA regulatory protein CdaR [Pontiella desulfatans]